MKISRSDFPDGFLFGAATAAYQIEGMAKGGAGSCHWDTFAATPGNVVGAEDGAVACDHYDRWSEDLDLVANAGLDAYRFSTSWCRILPEGRGTVNAEALDFYDKLVDGCLSRGLAPCPTLYHWDMPSALADLGGWTNPDVADWFADYTEIIMARIGDRVARTATINEPWCVAWLSHFLGIHAPGQRDIRAAARAMHHVMKAHGRSMTRMRDMGLQNLGLVLNFEHMVPGDDSPASAAATARNDAIYNRWFIQAAATGSYPDLVLDGLAPHMPKGWEADMAEISQPMDWLGVNYYTRSLVEAALGPWPALATRQGGLDKTQMGWEIYPDGLEQRLIKLAADYVDDLPIFVTENGMAWDDHIVDGAVDDPIRAAYLDSHLRATANAIQAGANVQGYFCWSLLDNYEWSFGCAKRFGLVHVDFQTQKRTPKASYHALKKALARP